MDAYVYQAALLCEDCAANVKADLDQHRDCDTDPPDDSDSYPQGPHQDGGGEADSPCHCDHCQTFLENPLTADGAAWLAEAFQAFILNGTGNPEVIEDWWGFYDVASDLSFDDLIRARLESLPCREHDDCRAHPLLGFGCKARGREHAGDDLALQPKPSVRQPDRADEPAWRDAVTSHPPLVGDRSADVLIAVREPTHRGPTTRIRTGYCHRVPGTEPSIDSIEWRLTGRDAYYVAPTHWAPMPKGPQGERQWSDPPDAIDAWWALSVLAGNAYPGIGEAYGVIRAASMSDPRATVGCSNACGPTLVSTGWVLSHLAGMRYPKPNEACQSLLRAIQASQEAERAEKEAAE